MNDSRTLQIRTSRVILSSIQMWLLTFETTAKISNASQKVTKRTAESTLRDMAHRESVTCHECRRSFGRLDHLQRHRLTHSDTVAHKCSRCKRAFKRKDSLIRHMTTCPSLLLLVDINHDRACYRCAGKKRKCGHQIPSCRSCTEVGHACRYPVQVCNNRASGNQAQAAEIPLPAAAPFTVETTLLETEKPESASTVVQENLTDSSTPQYGPTASEDAFAQHDPTLGMALEPYCPSPPPATSFPFLIHFTAQYSLIGCFKSTLR